MTHRRTLLLLTCLLVTPLAARAATLAEALKHWTGVTAEVVGQGDHVRVELPADTQIPAFTTIARPGMRAGDPGWTMTDITLPQPMHLQGGGTLTFGAQNSRAWLGARAAEVEARLAGISLTKDGKPIRLDQATLFLSSVAGPVSLNVDLAGPHVPGTTAPGAALLPHEVTLQGHTTPQGAAALAAMFGGRAGQGSAPVTIDHLAFDIGPAQFTGTGAVTLISPFNRTGEIDLAARHFGDLTRQIQADGADARIFATLMILRQLAVKKDGQMTWIITFAGAQMLVNGLDISGLVGK
jgi:hypothetical protein